MSNSQELKIHSSENTTNFFGEENSSSQNDQIKTEVNDNSSTPSKSNQERQNLSNSKFTCKKCVEFFYVEDLINHECHFETNIHNKNRGNCEYCHKLVDNPTTTHILVTKLAPSECDDFCTDCPNCNLKNVKIKQHFYKCPMKPKECYLRKLGCEGLVIMNELACTLTSGHEKIVEESLKGISGRIKNLRSFDFDVKHETREIESIYDDIKKLEQSLLEFRQKIETRRNGKLVWRIDNASEILENVKPKFSTAVYTSDFGYKLCLKIFPNGDGIGLNEYFSIFFVIMKGDYDDLLAWPFKNRIKITLYNKDVNAKSKHEVYKPDNSTAFNKPINQLNLASGNPRFISRKDLKESGFIIDDSIFIELNIDKIKTLF